MYRYIYTSKTINKISIKYPQLLTPPLAEGYRGLDPRNGELAQFDLRVHLPRVVNGSSASRFINNEKGGEVMADSRPPISFRRIRDS